MEALKEIVNPILKWYDSHARVLPWREDPSPYRVWVSEIMLQQTRVEAVKEYYLNFTARFPTVERLAEAEEDEVLKAWEGLGYYSRARNLLKAAKLIAEEGFPETYDGIRALAGVGDYTAGAISSIAFGLPCPAVDGNVLRVMTRYFADGSNIDEPATKAKFTEILRRAYPKEAGDFHGARRDRVCAERRALVRSVPVVGTVQGAPYGRGRELPRPERKKGEKDRKRDGVRVGARGKVRS